MSKIDRIPKPGNWYFQTWKLDFFCLCPFDLHITSYEVSLIIRLGYRVLKWVYARRMVGNHEARDSK